MNIIILIINKLIKFKVIFLSLYILSSCQPIDTVENIVFDNNLLKKLSFNAETKIINNYYDVQYSDPYIDHSLENPPFNRLNNWLHDNIIVFGSQNILIINILDASLSRIERENKSKKKYAEKKEFFYEINFIVEFNLYNDDKLILATTVIKANRTTTSGKFISLNEKQRIIDSITLDTLIDISIKSNDLLKIHMLEHIL